MGSVPKITPRAINTTIHNRHAGAVLGKKYLGGGLAPQHLGGNNEQNYCVQLSSIKQLMYRNYHKIGGAGQDLGGLCPLAPT